MTIQLNKQNKLRIELDYYGTDIIQVLTYLNDSLFMLIGYNQINSFVECFKDVFMNYPNVKIKQIEIEFLATLLVKFKQTC